MAKTEKGHRHRRIGDHELRPETLMMGYGYNPMLSEGSVKCPVFHTSTFVFRTAEEGKAGFYGEIGVYTGVELTANNSIFDLFRFSL